jgi:hypothetical protein
LKGYNLKTDPKMKKDEKKKIELIQQYLKVDDVKLLLQHNEGSLVSFKKNSN